MATLKILKKRIASVKNTQKITRAMKLVSAAKLRRATERAEKSRPFERELLSIVGQVMSQAISGQGEWNSPLREQRSTNKTALVVISTDRGLAGSLNTNNFKHVLRRIAELPQGSYEVISLGKKAADFFKRRGIKIHSSYADLIRKGSHEFVSSISKRLRELFEEGTFDRVEVFYTRFQSALVQVPSTFTMLPFAAEKIETNESFIYEPGPVDLLNQLVPMLIDLRLFRALLESIASEHGARMAAMESATKNAKDMIGALTLQRNRARQAAITKELMEIIGGAEALAG